MSLEAKVEYLAERVERPVYYASSAGRNAALEIDQRMDIVAVEINDARKRQAGDDSREFGMHASGYDLHELPNQVPRSLSGQV